MRAQGGDAAVDRQRAEERERHEDDRRERGEKSRRRESNAGLIPERGEIVHPGQAHDLPPGRGMFVMLGVGGGLAVKEPGSQ